MLVVLSDVSLEVSQLLRTLGKPTSSSEEKKSDEEKITSGPRTPIVSRIFFCLKIYNTVLNCSL